MNGLTDKEKAILERALDFCEENWSAFVCSCDEMGIEIEEEDTTDLKAKI